jgi:hypothetical protein
MVDQCNEQIADKLFLDSLPPILTPKKRTKFPKTWRKTKSNTYIIECKCLIFRMTQTISLYLLTIFNY